ncbi:hypothetical protein [Salipiger marinus]|uniref:Uncharacterized protein n=1 Tax=Salipiger marinus TaxID=555512 RepID=A0A1G8UM77_9RHOB|nr:hypothetical protein [Salipiger marinus]SDJ54100.1 hypothetical protein SAMN04487993_104316 [Salipiger marinus]
MGNKVSSDKDVVETFHGKHSIYEIVRSKGILKTDYHIYKNDSYHRGAFDSLARAIEIARNEG